MKTAILAIILGLATVAAAQTTAKPTDEFMGIKFGQSIAAQSPDLKFEQLGADSMTVSGPRVDCNVNAFVGTVGDSIGELGCSYSIDNSASVLAALVAKFGKARVSPPTVLQNGFGARVVRHLYAWRSGKLTVTFISPSSDRDECLLEVQTPEWTAEQKANRKSEVAGRARQF